jgi:hypothetical protein
MRTLRFKFTPNIQDMLTEFAQQHNKEPLSVYRTAWNAWMEKNREVIDTEVKRLTEAGYKGDAEDKMYKAARYYFRSRSAKRGSDAPASADDNTKTTTRRYITVPKTLLASMDQHIVTVKDNDDFRPSGAFERFAGMHDLSEAIRSLAANGLERDAARKKLKHTYKNRCFILRRKEINAAT